MSFGDAFYSVLGSAAGSALVGGVMDLFTDDTPVPARAQVRGSTAGQTAVSKATDLASLAQQKTTAGIQAGKVGKAFEAHEAAANFTYKNVDRKSVRERIVAELIAKGAPPAFIQNIKSKWKLSDENIQPRQFAQKGFAQQSYTAKV